MCRGVAQIDCARDEETDDDAEAPAPSTSGLRVRAAKDCAAREAAPPGPDDAPPSDVEAAGDERGWSSRLAFMD